MSKTTDFDKEVEKFLDSIVKGWLAMDFRTFKDIDFISYDPLISVPWTKRLLNIIDKVNEAGLSDYEVGKLFPNPSAIRCMMGFDLFSVKFSGTNQENREKIFSFYSNILKAICLEDPYAKEKNIIHRPEEIEKFLSKAEKANPDIARQLGRLSSACYNLSYALYSNMNPQIVYDNYGPYDVSDKFGKGYILAIKEFKNLNPVELWEEVKDFPYNCFRITCIYKNVDMTIDSASHVTYKGDLINGLQYYNLEMNDKKIKPEELEKIVPKIEEKGAEVYKLFSGFNLEDKKVKYYHTKAYYFIRLYGKLGLDWKPGKDILDAAKGKQPLNFELPENRNKLKALAREIWDLRKDGPDFKQFL